MAVWALGQLLDRSTFADVTRVCRQQETDVDVRQEYERVFS
jgi:hypothetical protein